jgi:hypothetical protein
MVFSERLLNNIYFYYRYLTIVKISKFIIFDNIC